MRLHVFAQDLSERFMYVYRTGIDGAYMDVRDAYNDADILKVRFCVHVCMYVSMYDKFFIFLLDASVSCVGDCFASDFVCIFLGIPCMCMYVCMYVCVFLEAPCMCMYVCIYV
jgi:hypothetical protein